MWGFRVRAGLEGGEGKVSLLGCPSKYLSVKINKPTPSQKLLFSFLFFFLKKLKHDWFEKRLKSSRPWFATGKDALLSFFFCVERL